MEFLLGESFRQHLDNQTYLDVSVYPQKWTTFVSMTLWKEGNALALSSRHKTHLNYNRFLPVKLAEKTAAYFLNRQSQKVAGYSLIPEKPYSLK